MYSLHGPSRAGFGAFYHLIQARPMNTSGIIQWPPLHLATDKCEASVGEDSDREREREVEEMAVQAAGFWSPTTLYHHHPHSTLGGARVKVGPAVIAAAPSSPVPTIVQVL